MLSISGFFNISSSIESISPITALKSIFSLTKILAPLSAAKIGCKCEMGFNNFKDTLLPPTKITVSL